MIFSRFVLFVALCISGIAAWYSVAGLTAIFAGALIPIIMMGGILEIAKITTTVWLHKYWDRSKWAIKTYLTVAVIALAFLTSMGIFGFLSKSHIDQGISTGDVASKIAIYDEKIKTEKDNIDANKQALRQLDAQVDQILSRSDTESGAARSASLRRAQQKERSLLLSEIQASQARVQKLNEERVPIAAEVRKVEAEVGPIKYIAALIYGDNADQNMLERAVRWVIILIVSVFDPLAIILILAANNSMKWEDDEKKTFKDNESSSVPESAIAEIPEKITKDIVAPMIEPTIDEKVSVPADESTPTAEQIAPITFEQGKYKTSYAIKDTKIELPTETVQPLELDEVVQKIDAPEILDDIPTEGITTEAQVRDDEYVTFEGKRMSIAALKGAKPELVANKTIFKTEILYGTKFPTVARTGDVYTRIDVVPHRTYKFNGTRWIMVDREKNTTYLQNTSYLQYLISKLDSGEYSPDMLTVSEQEEISEYLKRSV